MTNYNPIFKAIRAAITELTTPEANAWYRAKAKATAAWLMTITQKSTVTVSQWLNPKPVVEPVAHVEVETEAISPVTPDIAVAAETVAEDTTELRPSEVAEEETVSESTLDYKYLTELLAINPESQNAADKGDVEPMPFHSVTQNQSHLLE